MTDHPPRKSDTALLVWSLGGDYVTLNLVTCHSTSQCTRLSTLLSCFYLASSLPLLLHWTFYLPLPFTPDRALEEDVFLYRPHRSCRLVCKANGVQFSNAQIVSNAWVKIGHHASVSTSWIMSADQRVTFINVL